MIQNRESKSRHTLIVEKAAKATEERMLTFQINVDRTTGHSCLRNMNPGTDLVPFPKIKSNRSQMKISSVELLEDDRQKGALIQAINVRITL